MFVYAQETVQQFNVELHIGYTYLPTPPLGQDMTQGWFLSWV